MKTADGVPFRMGMTLWTLDEEPVVVDEENPPSEHGDTLWIDRGDRGGVIGTYFSSLEAVREFLTSPLNLCFSCRQICRPECADRGTLEHIPAIDGLVFRATGNYGSGVFDPMEYKVLQIVICDQCMLKHAAQVAYFPGPGIRERPWDPNRSSRGHYGD